MASLPPVLVTGARRGLGLQICSQFYQNGYPLTATSRNVNDLRVALIENQITATVSSLDFSLPFVEFNQELNKLPESFSTIIHSASPYGNETISTSSDEKLEIYGNFQKNNLSLLRFAGERLIDNGRLIMIGSIAGLPGGMISSKTMYSIYKSTLPTLVEAFNTEFEKKGRKAILISLGDMRESVLGKEALLESEVAQNVFEIFQQESPSSFYTFIAEEDPSHSKKK